jgi:hypothetical protein
MHAKRKRVHVYVLGASFLKGQQNPFSVPPNSAYKHLLINVTNHNLIIINIIFTLVTILT